MVSFGREVARANRQFLARAVTFMARSGIGQFIDLGTGLPTRPNVQEVARSVHPDAQGPGIVAWCPFGHAGLSPGVVRAWTVANEVKTPGTRR